MIDMVVVIVLMCLVMPIVDYEEEAPIVVGLYFSMLLAYFHMYMALSVVAFALLGLLAVVGYIIVRRDDKEWY